MPVPPRRATDRAGDAGDAGRAGRAANAADRRRNAPSGVTIRRTSGRTTMNSTIRPSSAMTPSSAPRMMSSLVNCR